MEARINTANNRFPKMLPKRRTFGKRNVRCNTIKIKEYYKMAKAFLSYSSKQSRYVHQVADELGRSNCLIDKIAIEQGMVTIDEIIKMLAATDVYVIFISNDALNSDWVKKELTYAKDKFDAKQITRIYPIIIDKNVTHKDDRIPIWMKESLNIQPVFRPAKAINLIKSRVKEVIWQKNPLMKLREETVVGRNDLIQKIEDRLDDYQKKTPVCVIAGGFPKVGRKTVLKQALLKSNIILNKSYEPITISLSPRESIEDFIIRLYDVCPYDDLDFSTIPDLSYEDKIILARKLVNSLQSTNEIVFVEDNGGVVHYDRSLALWFKEIVRSDLSDKLVKPQITFCIASSFRIQPHLIIKDAELFSVEVPELSKKERGNLFKRLLDLYGLQLNIDEVDMILPVLNGFPEQVFYAVDLIRSEGFNYAKRNTNLVASYQKDKFAKILNQITSDEYTKNLLSLLTDFDFISYDFIYDLINFNEQINYQNVINLLIGQSVIEHLGINKEYIRLNDGVRDFLQRAGYRVPDKFRERLKTHLRKSLADDQIAREDVSDFLYSLKAALQLNPKLANKYLLPSHYLKTMIYLYERERKYPDVVELADRILEKENKLDRAIVREIRQWLCHALARLKHERFKTEVQYFRENVLYDYLFGFYYRMTGKPQSALDRLYSALEQNSRFQRARRELVKVLLALEQYEEAYEHAKINYELEKGNPYHIQAFFECLMYRNEPDKTEILKFLIEELKNLGTKKSTEMAQLAEADYLAIIDNNSENALKKVQIAQDEFGSTPYSTMKKFNIYEKKRDIINMERTIDSYEKGIANDDIGDLNRLYIMKAKLSAHKGEKATAVAIIDNRLQFYPDNLKLKLKRQLQNI